jgi:DNA-binding LacI/PurR family transcriptional regulator
LFCGRRKSWVIQWNGCAAPAGFDPCSCSPARRQRRRRTARHPPQGEFERRVWAGVHSYLEQQGIATRLQHSTVSPEEAQQHASDIGVSGLVLLGGVRERSFVKELQAHEIPFVIAGAHLRPLEVNCVMADVGQGIQQAMRHLIERGHQRIGFVNGPSTTTTSAEKLDAYRLMLCLNDLPFEPDQVIVSDFGAESGYRQTLRLLEQRSDLDAVIFADDVIALGGMRAIRERAYQVPHDLAVVGFGDYDLARLRPAADVRSLRYAHDGRHRRAAAVYVI